METHYTNLKRMHVGSFLFNKATV